MQSRFNAFGAMDPANCECPDSPEVSSGWVCVRWHTPSGLRFAGQLPPMSARTDLHVQWLQQPRSCSGRSRQDLTPEKERAIASGCEKPTVHPECRGAMHTSMGQSGPRRKNVKENSNYYD